MSLLRPFEAGASNGIDDALGIDCGGIGGIDACESEGGGNDACCCAAGGCMAGRDIVGTEGGSDETGEGNIGPEAAGAPLWPMLAIGFESGPTEGRGGGGG